jgi:hypothetical protein
MNTGDRRGRESGKNGGRQREWGEGGSALLGLAATGVGHQQCPVVGQEGVLDLLLALLINDCKPPDTPLRQPNHLRHTPLRPDSGSAHHCLL